MRLVVVGSHPPTERHTVRAAPIVLRQMLAGIQERGHEVLYQLLVAPDHDRHLSVEDEADLRVLGEAGIRVLEPRFAADAVKAPSRSPLARARRGLAPRVRDYFPAAALSDEVASALDDVDADAVVHVWSATALAACSALRTPTFAYYGNPDPKPIGARLGAPELFDEVPRGRLARRRALYANEARRRLHLELMRTATWAANVCAVDADWYAANGHPRAFYIQNMWLDAAGPDWEERKIAAERSDDRFLTGLGGMYATGNTFGLWFTATEIVPELERRLGDRFMVDVAGAGTSSRRLAAALAHPRISLRGFVDDADQELREAKVFLIANNCRPEFVVGHTRILHAWSLGACVVGHTNTAVAMPELVSGDNCLLGSTAAEIAEHVETALADEALRRRLGRRGRETFEREFLPDVVVGRILSRIEAG